MLYCVFSVKLDETNFRTLEQQLLLKKFYPKPK